MICNIIHDKAIKIKNKNKKIMHFEKTFWFKRVV